jgi:hypothetical protein
MLSTASPLRNFLSAFSALRRNKKVTNDEKVVDLIVIEM